MNERVCVSACAEGGCRVRARSRAVELWLPCVAVDFVVLLCFRFVVVVGLLRVDASLAVGCTLVRFVGLLLVVVVVCLLLLLRALVFSRFSGCSFSFAASASRCALRHSCCALRSYAFRSEVQIQIQSRLSLKLTQASIDAGQESVSARRVLVIMSSCVCLCRPSCPSSSSRPSSPAGMLFKDLTGKSRRPPLLCHCAGAAGLSGACIAQLSGQQTVGTG
eukprot:scaffold21336_cov98-Isochrysis_galbana.AAC.3